MVPFHSTQFMKEKASFKVNTRIPQYENTQLRYKGRKIRNRVKCIIKLITNIQLKLKTQCTRNFNYRNVA